ncbi:MAG: hypothetical protein ACO288_02315 [Ilumatobacteraceae bacterium]
MRGRLHQRYSPDMSLNHCCFAWSRETGWLRGTARPFDSVGDHPVRPLIHLMASDTPMFLTPSVENFDWVLHCIAPFYERSNDTS